jgi:hypothetical protein
MQLTFAKRKLKLGEHLLDHQVQNSANKIDTTSDIPINRQCHHYKWEQTNNSSDECKFDDFTTNDLIKLQNSLRTNSITVQNLISAKCNANMQKFNQSDKKI